MNTYSLYIHTFPNGKRYVGITSAQDPSKRWSNGKGYRHQPLMNNAIQKYGWENVSHEIRLTGLTHEEACKREQFYISLFRSNEYSFGYNMTLGGEGADKGKNCYSKEYIAAYSKTYRDTHREKVNEGNRKSHKRRMEQPEYAKKYKEGRNEYAKKYYEEHKEQRREQDRKYYEEHREYIKKYNEERKEQLRENDRKYRELHREEIRAKDRERYWKKKNSIKPSE